MIHIEKYSFGIGDRFAMQGRAQLLALMKTVRSGIPIVPVWNKSNREHQIIHSKPEDTQVEAERAVQESGWKMSYYVDADHINLNNVDGFIEYCNFFTIDVADFIGKKASKNEIERFIQDHQKYIGKLVIPGINDPFLITNELLNAIGTKFLLAAHESEKIYSYIASKKGSGNFITEISMDEVDEAQSPVELFFILSMLGKSGIPLQTIAPKFTGRFNKGIDYVGDLSSFSQEFEMDVLVIDFAVKVFSLPENLKLSIHSGSDKFSLYPIMGNLIRKYDKGIHIKTAGTTWLEEMIGLSMAGGDALELAKSIYFKAYERRDELCGPYATVIDINDSKLPTPSEVTTWSSQKFADTLRHIPDHKDYNSNFRQLIHVGYKVAAEYKNVYLDMLKKYAHIVGQQVTENIYERHLKRLFDIRDV